MEEDIVLDEHVESPAKKEASPVPADTSPASAQPQEAAKVVVAAPSEPEIMGNNAVLASPEPSAHMSSLKPLPKSSSGSKHVVPDADTVSSTQDAPKPVAPQAHVLPPVLDNLPAQATAAAAGAPAHQVHLARKDSQRPPSPIAIPGEQKIPLDSPAISPIGGHSSGAFTESLGGADMIGAGSWEDAAFSPQRVPGGASPLSGSREATPRLSQEGSRERISSSFSRALSSGSVGSQRSMHSFMSETPSKAVSSRSRGSRPSNSSEGGPFGFGQRLSAEELAQQFTYFEQALKEADAGSTGKLTRQQITLAVLYSGLQTSLPWMLDDLVKLACEQSDTDGSGRAIAIAIFLQKLRVAHGTALDAENLQDAKVACISSPLSQPSLALKSFRTAWKNAASHSTASAACFEPWLTCSPPPGCPRGPRACIDRPCTFKVFRGRHKDRAGRPR